MEKYEDLRKIEQLDEIIINKSITAVFQPIVSLKDGSVLGFEGLSRMNEPGLFNNTEELFLWAEKNGRAWQLEQVCRHAILHEISRQKKAFDECNAKLFINASPKVLHDEKFQAGFTKEYTKRYGIDTKRIVFEITERERVENEASFQAAINYYKNQDYQIAIDDAGAAYSGLSRICNLEPNYIKLDISLVKEIYNNSLKYAMVKGMVEFSRSSGIFLIAEGIETKEEKDALTELGVQYGQGYYYGKPTEEIKPYFESKENVSPEYLEYRTLSFAY